MRTIIGLVLVLAVGSPALADQAFWRNLSKKYGDERPVIGLLNECLDLVTYTGEVEVTDVTKQSGLETTKSAAQFKGSRFALESRFHTVTAVFDAERAADVATVRIPIHSKRSVSDLSARVIRRDGTPVSVPNEKITEEPIAPGFPAYADLRWRVVNFGPLPDSCILDLEYAVQTTEEFAANRFQFDHPYPTDQARYTITAPVSVVQGFTWWTESFRTYNDPGKPNNETVAGSSGEMKRYTWELDDVAEMPVEALSVPLVARSRSIDLTVAFEREWNKMLEWYRGQVDGVFEEDARAAEMAREIVRGIDDDSLKARAIYEHVRKRVRWVPIPFQWTTLVPDPPSEVLERGYADAKDMAACLAFLLRSAGLEAHMALVSTAPSGRFDRQFPTWLSFDHALVYLLLPLRDVWLDPTDPTLGFGVLPEALAGGHWDSPALPFIVWNGGPNFWGREGVVQVPAYGLGDCGYKATEPEIAWDPSGTALFRTTLEFRGAPSLALRRSLLGKTPEEQKAVFAAWLARDGGEENVVEVSAPNLENLDEPLRVRYAVSRPWSPGADEIRIPSRFFGLPYPVEIPSEPKRYTSVAFTYPLDLSQSVSVAPPEGYAVAAFPTDVEVNSNFMDFGRQYVDMSGTLQITSSLRVDESTVDQNRYGHFLRQIDEIRKSGNEEIVFRKTPLVGRAGG